ncbi:hypothetical protein IQ07DRAFT_545149, partial [Pyrenochaeta sp. DS3sAY3a]
MPAFGGTTLYQEHYNNALHLFETGDMASCISAAKTSLRDISLSVYYKTKNYIIIAAAYDDWDNAEVWRLAAEQAYTTAFLDANQKDDPISIRILEYFRKDLDELREFEEQDMAATIAEF